MFPSTAMLNLAPLIPFDLPPLLFAHASQMPATNRAASFERQSRQTSGSAIAGTISTGYAS